MRIPQCTPEFALLLVAYWAPLAAKHQEALSLGRLGVEGQFDAHGQGSHRAHQFLELSYTDAIIQMQAEDGSLSP